jgi:DNA-binding CsgD family transcriptional regulator
LNHENCIYEFTTLPFEWLARYDQNAYLEVDPQVVETWNRTVPFVWDQSTVRGHSKSVDAYLDDALRHGIASGVSLPHFDATGTRVLVTLNSRTPTLGRNRRDEVTNALGDMLIVVRYFHELFLTGAIKRGMSPRNSGMALSAREHACLALAARGLSNDAIGKQLGIAAHATQLHFASILSKMMVANRREAINRAISEGQITV